MSSEAPLTPGLSTWLDVAMKRVKIAELKDHLSEHLRAVEKGASIEVTDRDRPIARIVPVPKEEPKIKLIPPKRPFREIHKLRFESIDLPFDVVDILLEDRRKR